jgi:signal transduction histidine kinase
VLVRNLVDNAVRYSGAGTNVRVDVVANAASVRLVVIDEGPGVAPEQRRALGERFYRVPGSQQTGSGLGLSIVRRIAELHHANVAFDDGPGRRGLCVVVTFPASSTARPWVSPERADAG